MELFQEVMGEGPDLVLAHGALDSGREWASFLPALGSRFRLWIPDLPSHGRSPSDPEKLSIPRLARILEDWLGAQGIDRPWWVGHSLGGFLGLVLEARRPGTFRGLVLHAPKTFWSPEAIAAFRAQLDPDRLTIHQERLRERHTLADQPERWRDLCRALSEMVGGYRDAPPLSLEALQQVRIPILITVGDADPLFPVAEAQELAKSLPSAQLRILKGADHRLPARDPAAWLDHALPFLAGSQPPRP